MTSTESLRRAGPLSDPVRIIARWTLIGTILSLVLLLAGELPPLVWLWSESPVLGLAGAGELLLAGMTLPIAVWLVLWPGRTMPVLYVRAFRSDTAPAGVRQLLRAALGARFRVCGIRPPRARVSWPSRLLLTAAAGFRYVGSNQFELEASDANWMVRFLASCGNVAFIVADVRDMTPHLAQEIGVGFAALGPARCLFLIDSSRTEEDWRTAIAAVLGDVDVEADRGRLEIICEEPAQPTQITAFFRSIQSFLARLPSGHADLERALPHLEALVPVASWPTPIWEKDWAQFLAAAAIVNGLVLALAIARPGAELGIVIMTPVYAFLFLRALVRVWRDERAQARLRRAAGQKRDRFRAWLAFGLFLSWLAGIALVPFLLPGLVRARAVANEIGVITSLRTVLVAEIAYSSTCGDGGYAATLEDLALPPSPSAAAFIPADLAHDGIVKYGYRFRVSSDAGASVVTRHDSTCPAPSLPLVSSFFAEAHPIDGGGPSRRSFAVDSRGEIYVREDGSAIEPGMAGARPLQ